MISAVMHHSALLKQQAIFSGFGGGISGLHDLLEAAMQLQRYWDGAFYMHVMSMSNTATEAMCCLLHTSFQHVDTRMNGLQLLRD